MCLASPKQLFVPDSGERAILQTAGLGEKRIALDLHSEGWEIYEELQFNFPKLKEAGGFELLRVPECGGKSLQMVAMPETGYTVEYLKAVVHNAKIYLRPLQKD